MHPPSFRVRLVSLGLLLSIFGSCVSAARWMLGQQNAITLRLSTTKLTVRQGSSEKAMVSLARLGTIGRVTLAVKGLPAGATISYLNPGSADGGQITVMTTTASEGAYPMTVEATDGTNTAVSSLSLVVVAGVEPADPYEWSSTGPLISAIPDSSHTIVAVKDPTAVFYKNSWNIYATTADTSGGWNMVYLRFNNWKQAAAAKPYYMDATPGLKGYDCAPELFYFTPQKKWYLIYQSGPPQFSTTTDPTKPETWSPPQSFFANEPSGVKGWLDFWVICDSANCYLFFTNDAGDFFRSQTTVANFPGGFDAPQVIMKATAAGEPADYVSLVTARRVCPDPPSSRRENIWRATPRL